MKLVFCVLFWSCLWATSNADCSNTTDVTQTVFLLCTPETGDVTHTIPHDASDLGNFNPSRRTFVMMHGFQEDGSDWPVGQGFNEAFNSAGSFNLIYVNWVCLASLGTAYITAAKNALKVGNYTGEFLDNLITASGLNHADLHLVGFSLGGQGVGAMGRKLEKLSGTKADRLTSIDPAAPFFDILEPVGNWVGYNDANFVDVIHVNSDYVFCGGLSLAGPLGNVDFYPNGGLHQPGCTDFGPLITTFWQNDVTFMASCSHSKGKDYFKESLTSDFTGTLCESWESFSGGGCDGNAQSNMGIALNSSEIVGTGLVTYGKYYMNVNENSPYYTGSKASVLSQKRDDFTPSFTSFWGRSGASSVCTLANVLKQVTFGQYDLTQTAWYHSYMATTWYNYS